MTQFPEAQSSQRLGSERRVCSVSTKLRLPGFPRQVARDIKARNPKWPAQQPPTPGRPLPSNAAGLPSNAASPSLPRPTRANQRDSAYLLFLLSSSELDAEEKQEEEKGKAPRGQVPQPPPRLSPAWRSGPGTHRHRAVSPPRTVAVCAQLLPRSTPVRPAARSLLAEPSGCQRLLEGAGWRLRTRRRRLTAHPVHRETDLERRGIGQEVGVARAAAPCGAPCLRPECSARPARGRPLLTQVWSALLGTFTSSCKTRRGSLSNALPGALIRPDCLLDWWKWEMKTKNLAPLPGLSPFALGHN
jgi:hypothetical protein